MKSVYAVLITMMAWLTLAAISQVTYVGVANAGSEHESSSKQLVIAIHQFELEDGVDMQEFEAFVLEEIVPLYNKVKGQNAYLMKGDRGLRSGKYSMVLSFPSVETRNRIYPPEGGFSEEFEKIFEGTDALFEKLDAFIVGDPWVNHTDYVTVLP